MPHMPRVAHCDGEVQSLTPSEARTRLQQPLLTMIGWFDILSPSLQPPQCGEGVANADAPALELHPQRICMLREYMALFVLGGCFQCQQTIARDSRLVPPAELPPARLRQPQAAWHGMCV